MKSFNSQVQFNAGDVRRGFRVREVRDVPGIRGVAYMFDHTATGAQFLHIHCDDPENLFSINFATPPPDDTGLPHILEHAVLAGSKRFPVREPFFEMIKMSMATFINAMTGWDCTYYPVCSNVPADLFNLAEVYFDAVFHPLLAETTFRREGHHLAPGDDQSPPQTLTINGIVYNEMKSNFSQPEGRLQRAALRGLFPDTPYGLESGGDPEAIPQLTYDDFLNFHRNYYNPTNARFLCYGDIDPEKHLDFLADHLDTVAPGPRAPNIPVQPRWSEPRQTEDVYAVDDDEDLAAKTYHVSTWIVGGADDPVDQMQLYILGLILTGNEAAPLRKALVDSRIGEDVVFTGFSSVGRESVFRVGVKGSEPERAADFRELVETTLESLAESGFDDRHVRAAFQQAAYDFQEVSTLFPLNVLEEVLDAWLYERDPLTYMNADELLAETSHRYAADPHVFRALIRDRLIDNPHRLDLLFKPDREHQATVDSKLARDLVTRRQAMSDADAERVAEEAARVEAEAGAPNTPADVATLPQLSVQDLPPKPREVDTETTSVPGGGTFLHNRVFSNGVNYLRLEFDLRGFPAELWEAVPRYIETVRKLGAGDWDFQEVAWRQAEATGGLHAGLELRTSIDPPGTPALGVTLDMKALDQQLDPALDLLETILFEANPDDRARFSDVITQTRARLRTRLVQDGLGTARRHAARHLFAEAERNEQLRGLPQLDRVEQLVAGFDCEFPRIVESVCGVRDFLLAPNRFSASFTGSVEAAQAVHARLDGWIARMQADHRESEPSVFTPLGASVHEGLAAPIQVSHCVRAFRTPGFESELAPLLMLGTQLINIDYLISEIRLKGNAYGAGCQYRGLPGHMILFSYADPHIARTYRVFDGLLDYVHDAPWTKAELDRAIITTAKGFQTPIRPEAATSETLGHFRTGLTPERRAHIYQRLLAAEVDQVREAFSQVLEQARDCAANCVVSSRTRLESAKTEMNVPMTIRPILRQTPQSG